MPDPIDIHVGSRVRMKRTLKGLTQAGLGEVVGLTFQQIQKYERGTNRIGSSRLFKLAHALDTPVGFFFDEMPTEIVGYGKKGMADQAEPFEIDRTVLRRATLEFVRAYDQIADPSVQEKFRALVLSIADSDLDFSGSDDE